MQNQRRSGSTGLMMSCEGKRYTFPLKTRAVGSALYSPLMIGFWAKRLQESSRAPMGRMNLFMVVYFLKMWGMNSLRQRRQVSHSWAVPGDS